MSPEDVESSAAAHSPVLYPDEYRSVDRYLRPESQASVATLRPGPRVWATRRAATTFAPVDVPANRASSRQPASHVLGLGGGDL